MLFGSRCPALRSPPPAWARQAGDPAGGAVGAAGGVNRVDGPSVMLPPGSPPEKAQCVADGRPGGWEQYARSPGQRHAHRGDLSFGERLAQAGECVARGHAGDRRDSLVLRPTPPRNRARDVAGRHELPGRHAHTLTSPGGTRSKPSNQAPISALVRPVTGAVPWYAFRRVLISSGSVPLEVPAL